MITRPLGGGRPSPAQGHRPNPWSDPSSASPQVNTQQLPTYAPYPAPQPASSASTSQNNLPPIIRRAPFPTIPAHELQASQKVSQIPIFGVNTIGGAIPQGGGGGANSQGGENDQDESNDNGNANKGKRMQKPSNAYTIPTVRKSPLFSDSSPEFADQSSLVSTDHGSQPFRHETSLHAQSPCRI